MVGLRCLAALALSAVLAVPLAVADHRQPMHGSDPSDFWVQFDHVKGNEWWVEVRVTASHYGEPSVSARTESGAFHRLTRQPWGVWAGSFHVPPGEKVQFNAQASGSMSDIYNVNSCLFTHPAGVESCPPGVTDDFRAGWRPSGNAWWEQVHIDSNRPVASAGMMVDDVSGGRHYALKHESWGGWTQNQNVPQGYTVQFFANDGAQGVESPCYRWTAATETACPPSYGPNGPAPYQTRFDHMKGNAWWVEVKVGPVEPTRVWAQDDGGPWVELSLRDWGNWAGSFHVEPGHKMRFQAEFSVSHQPVLTSCWFTHPAGFAPDGNQICRNLENSS